MKLKIQVLSLALLIAEAALGFSQATKLRVGFFPNITHSQALIGLARGDFAASLGADVTIDAKAFNAGPSVIEALFAGQLDISYIGPNPAINGYVKSKGEALRVIAGATSGGAAFLVRSDVRISDASDLSGKVFASPQLGNTQDVALRSYLAKRGLMPRGKASLVTVQPMENPTILDALRQKRIDGAWVPEPWAARLQTEGGARLFIDERDLWDGGDFSTALIIVSTKFLKQRPDIVKSWLRAHVSITKWEIEHPAEARRLVNQEIAKMTGVALKDETLSLAWSRMKPTWDPLISTLQKSADAAFDAGFLPAKQDLSALVDPGPLNSVLAEMKLPTVR
jgi:NitT/TauT family transport system substrate-binding protein